MQVASVTHGHSPSPLAICCVCKFSVGGLDHLYVLGLGNHGCFSKSIVCRLLLVTQLGRLRQSSSWHARSGDSIYLQPEFACLRHCNHYTARQGHLGRLSINKHKLSAEDFVLLSQGNFLLLTSLEIKDPCLDAEGMAMLTKANWPSLQNLHRCLSLNLGPSAIVHLLAANWPIGHFSLLRMPVNTATSAQLAKLSFSNLIAIYLIETDLTTAIV